MGTPGLSMLQDGMRALATHPDLRGYGAPLVEQLADVPVFARDGAGTPLQAVTPAATRLLAGDLADRTRKILDTAASFADQRPNSPFRSIVLPDSPDALSGWWKVRDTTAWLAEHPDWSQATHAPADELYLSPLMQQPTDATETFGGAAAHYDEGSVVDLSPGLTGGMSFLFTRDSARREAALRGALAGLVGEPEIQHAITSPPGFAYAQGVHKLVHEIEHADGVAEVDDLARVVEEGGDQVISMWPGRLQSFIAQAGLGSDVAASDVAHLDRTAAYPSETADMRSVVRLAGIDIDDPAALPEATSLLRGHRLAEPALDDVYARVVQRTGSEQAANEEIGRVWEATIHPPVPDDKLEAILQEAREQKASHAPLQYLAAKAGLVPFMARPI